MKKNNLKRAMAIILTLLMAQSVVTASVVTTSAVETQQAESLAVKTEQVESSTSDFSYTIMNGKIKITKYNGNSTEVTIPTTIGSHNVVYLGSSVFSDNKTLTKQFGTKSINPAFNFLCYCVDDIKGERAKTIVNYLHLKTLNDLMKLDAAQLTSVPGIGEVLTGKILEALGKWNP